MWTIQDKKGFYFSPKDLSLYTYINELKTSGISSLKIEGRMKSPHYVYNTVKSYKLLLSNNDAAFKEACCLPENDFAREKATFNFIKKSDDIFTPKLSKQTGIYFGKITKVHKLSFMLKSSLNLNIGDTLKIVDSAKDTSYTTKVLNITIKNDSYEIETNLTSLKVTMDVFKISNSYTEKNLKMFTIKQQ
jgi:putative protease